MRGKPARTVGEMSIQNEVVEYVLTTKAGLSRRDLFGERRTSVTVEKRFDLAALVRRAMASVGRSDTFVAAAATATVMGIAGAVTGSVPFGAVGVLWLVIAGIIAFAPDWVFEEPDPKASKSVSKVPGMGDKEVARRMAIHAKRNDIREEKIEERRRRQERKAKTRQGF